MKSTALPTFVLGAAITMAWGFSSAAEEKADVGKFEYENSCAVCHGVSGKGDGPMAGIIDTLVPDLTTLAERNDGVFPLARVYEFIDGTETVEAHGTREMPIWGRRFNVEAAEYHFDVPYDAEAIVRARLLGVAEYLYRLQE